MNDYVLYVADHGAMLWHARLARQGMRAAHPDQAQGLADLLWKQPRAGVVVLADAAGQEVRLDSLPKLGWFDRRALLQRRMQQAFPPPAQVVCLACRKQEDGWAASFGHLPDQGGSQKWLRWLETLPNPKRGTILTSDTAAALIVRSRRHAVPEWEHMFVLTLAGLRQVTLRRGMPVLTRLLPCAATDAADLGTAIMQAQAESQNYLARQGWRPDAPMRVIVIAPEADALCAVLPREVTVAAPEQVAAALGLPECRDGTQVLAAACAARRRRLGVFQPAPAQAAQRTGQMRRWGWAAAALVVLGHLGVAGQDFAAMLTARRAAQASVAESRQWQDGIAALRHRLEGNMTQPMRQKQADMLRAAVLPPAPMPWDMMQVLSQNLPEQIRLGAFDWRAEAGGGTVTQMTLRLFPTTKAKDAAQTEALGLYQDLVTKMTAALPRAQVKAVQAPYALDAAHPFNDPALLLPEAPLMPTALLEIREP